MIYSARVLEIHSNFCSCKAGTMDEARQKFLNGNSDCDGFEEYVSTVTMLDIQENPDHDQNLKDIDSPKHAEALVAKALGEKAMGRLRWGIARVNAFLRSLDENEDLVYDFLVKNNWQGLRGFLAGLQDELKGDHDEPTAGNVRVEVRLPKIAGLRPIIQYLCEHDAIIESIQDADEDTVLFAQLPEEHLEEAAEFAKFGYYFLTRHDG